MHLCYTYIHARVQCASKGNVSISKLACTCQGTVLAHHLRGYRHVSTAMAPPVRALNSSILNTQQMRHISTAHSSSSVYSPNITCSS
eukprot:7856-Heterococcus_DN1.PRE.1